MADKTKIAWTDASWNPVTGCTRVSPACENCYAFAVAKRFPQTHGSKDFSTIICHEDRLSIPMKWKKPKRIFVPSMGDLFHKDVPYEFKDRVIATTENADWHTYQILTKRPEDALEYSKHIGGFDYFPNLWLGCTVENQEWADRRISYLLETLAAKLFLSLEPMLGPVDLEEYLTPVGAETCSYGQSHQNGTCDCRQTALQWVIVGCESGPKRRPTKIEWIESVVSQCREAGVPVFVKQMEVNGKVTHNMEDFPEHLRIREFPDSTDA